MTALLSASVWLTIRFPEIDRMWDSPKKALVDAVLLAVVLLIYHRRERLPKIGRVLLLAGYALVIAVAFFQTLQLMQTRVRALPLWDFRVFWAYGELMADGKNVYATESYNRFYDELTPSQPFIESVMQVGATYPPPTMFLFRPLGCCEVRTAYKYWYVFLLLCLVASAELLRRTFLKASGIWGFALVMLLIFSLHGTWDTVRYAQTNFLALLMFLLYWRDRVQARAGMWVALGAVVKLYLGVLLFDSLIFKRWRAVMWALGSGVVLALASLLLLGPSTFLSYFTLHPTSRIPGWVYVEWMNQSLLGTILRVIHAPVAGGSLARNPLFVVAALALTLATAWLVYRVGANSEWGLALWILLALIIYPGTLAHYSVMLLPVLLLLWRDKEKTALGVWGTTLLLILVLGLVGFNSHAFSAYLLTWFTVAGISLLAKTRDTHSAVVAANI